MRAKSATAAEWAERVRGWRASGETAATYGAQHGFSGKGLHTWASRLGASQRRAARATPLQLVRVDRVTTAAPTVTGAARLHVEFGDDVRVAVERGFDRATLAAIVDVLASRCAR